MARRRYIVVSRMVIDGTVKTEGDVASLDPDDKQVRGWLRAGNIRLKKGRK